MKKNLDAHTTTLMMDAMAYAYVMGRSMSGDTPTDEEILQQVKGLMAVYCINENLVPDYSMTISKLDIEDEEEEELEEEEEEEDGTWEEFIEMLTEL